MKNIKFYEPKKYEDSSKYEKEYLDEEDGEMYLTMVIE